MRTLLGVLGLVLILLALLLWLLPNGDATTTTSETTSTSNTGTDAGETTVTKTGTTTKPGDGVSETLIGVLLGTGAILALVAAFWDRIQEVGLPGGASLKLSAARATSIGLDDVADAIQRKAGAAARDAASTARMMSSLASHIVEKAQEIAAGETRVVRVDLEDGKEWLPITKTKRFTTTVDKCRVSLELARPVVRAEQATAK